jgi:hypothetical protein
MSSVMQIRCHIFQHSKAARAKQNTWVHSKQPRNVPPTHRRARPPPHAAHAAVRVRPSRWLR